MTPEEFLKGKSVLVVVLGMYGGGAQTAKWLFAHGAKVTVTDFRTEKELSETMKLFTPEERKGIRFVLGRQSEEDFSSHDIIVLGPGVSRESPYLAIALKAEKQIESDASLFFRFVKNPVIAVTGTRGKSTTTMWLSHMLSQKYGTFIPTGNNPDRPFLKELSEIKNETRPVVAEMSSWQLEYLSRSDTGPKIAIITNIFPDHLNRYSGKIEEYALAKANIFKKQTEDDFLLLNDQNKWTSFFLAKRPQASVYFFTRGFLAKGKNGMFVKDGAMIFRKNEEEKKILDVKIFAEKMGEHNLENLLAVALAIVLFDPDLKITQKMIQTLPQVRFRQEIIFSKKELIVVNDSASTSPDATIMALRRFGKCVLIVGGTDKQLVFAGLAKEIKKMLTPENVIFLNGSATQKLMEELKKIGFFKKQNILLFETLEECADRAFLASGKKGIVLFSPGAASFEKFKNEFDRGEKFNRAIEKFLCL